MTKDREEIVKMLPEPDENTGNYIFLSEATDKLTKQVATPARVKKVINNFIELATYQELVKDELAIALSKEFIILERVKEE